MNSKKKIKTQKQKNEMKRNEVSRGKKEQIITESSFPA